MTPTIAPALARKWWVLPGKGVSPISRLATSRAPAPLADDPTGVVFSPDFAFVLWYGRRFAFTRMQRKAVAELWRSRKSGHGYVRQQDVIEAIDSDGTRLRDIFRGHPAWGTLIVPACIAVEDAPMGSYRLAPGPLPAVQPREPGLPERPSPTTGPVGRKGGGRW